jgi:hypothetical protein
LTFGQRDGDPQLDQAARQGAAPELEAKVMEDDGSLIPGANWELGLAACRERTHARKQSPAVLRVFELKNPAAVASIAGAPCNVHASGETAPTHTASRQIHSWAGAAGTET